MKILKKIIACLLGLALVGCKDNVEFLEFDQKKTYETEQVTLKFRAMHTSEQVNPVNQNDEFTYRYSKDENDRFIDIQFYVENKTDETIDVYDSLRGRITLDEEEVFYRVSVETDNYTIVEEESKLESHQKSIAHMMFIVPQDKLNKVKEAEIWIEDQPYLIAIDEIEVIEEKVEKNDTIKSEKFDFTILSGSASKVIPALNLEADDLEWYEMEDEKKQYAGGYAEITNKTNQSININKEIAVYLDIEGKNLTSAWWSILTKDEARFEEGYDIQPNETRKVLFFIPIPLDYEDTNYTFHYIIEGKPYSYTYKHIVIAR